MPKDDRLYLGNMLDMARRAMRLIEGVGQTGYMRDEMLRLALTHLVQVIGEAARHASEETRASLSEIP